MLAPDRDDQLRYWDRADETHLRWQTESGYVAETERALLEAARTMGSGRLLEIGCGEGGNLINLGADDGSVGLDFATSKLGLARKRLPGSSFVAGDAGRLPFSDSAFGRVLVRDLLHHAPVRQAVLDEAVRVLRPGGAITVIEPNRNSPLIVAQALLVPAERAVLVSTKSRLVAELSRAGFEHIEVRRAQPFPIARVLCHPRLRLSERADRPFVRRLLGAADRLCARVVPRAAWMYLVARAHKASGAIR